jgi:hypothetical protein
VILADEMGLGKTIQTIAFLTALHEARLGVVFFSGLVFWGGVGGRMRPGRALATAPHHHQKPD